MSRQQIDLAGNWERWIRGRKWDTVVVPSSLRPSGIYTLQRNIRLPAIQSENRLFLSFDGVAYHASVRVNGQDVGQFGPYVPANLEITKAAKEGDNKVEVTICDLEQGTNTATRAAAAIGVNLGWEAYGGIIRGVRIETRPSAFVDNVRTTYELSSDFQQAGCTFRLFLSALAPVTAEASVEVFHGTNRTAQATASLSVTAGISEHDIRATIAQPLLWEPQHPHLYRVVVTLRTPTTSDVYEFRTGFRHLRIQGRKIEWNGKSIQLQGFCRHDMWEGQGFTLTSAQMRHDMLAIKQTGANYVRLSHYPHHRQIIDLADELGLLVTEEPGYWQVDFATIPEPQITAGLDTLAATIRRDWNSPSIFGWFLGNESALTLDYLKRGKALCDRLDPLKRPVSFANDRKPETVKPMFEEAGLDFFSQHLYTFNSNKFEETAALYGDGKPFFVDEWGWEDAGRGQIFWERNFDHMLSAVRSGAVTGHAFWSWNDVREYSRIDWPTFDGILFSGVVTESRSPRAELYERFIRLFQNREEHPGSSSIGLKTPFRSAPDLVPLRFPVVKSRTNAQPVDIQTHIDSNDSTAAWTSVEKLVGESWSNERMARNQWERTGKQLRFWTVASADIAGLPFRFALKDGFVRPLAVTQEHPEIAIPVNRSCNDLYLLGGVTVLAGYPLQGKHGEVAAVLEKRYMSGRIDRMPLRNGIEIARSNIIHGATRIEPIASAAPRALLFQKDPAREQYQALLLSSPVSGQLAQIRLVWKSGPPLLFFAITTTSAIQKVSA